MATPYYKRGTSATITFPTVLSRPRPKPNEPTRRSVELLLKELDKAYWSEFEPPELESVEKEITKLEAQFKRLPKMVALLKRKKKLEEQAKKARETFKTETTRVRHLFLSQGVTKEVLAELQHIVQLRHNLPSAGVKKQRRRK